MRTIDGELRTESNEPMTLADRDPGDVVVLESGKIVVLGSLLGMFIGKKRKRVEPHTALLSDVDPETMMPVVRDHPDRRLRLWYAADPSTVVIEIVETVDHRRSMRDLTDRRRLLVETTLRSDENVDPVGRWTRDAHMQGFPPGDVPF